jgi:hypothetical protein
MNEQAKTERTAALTSLADRFIGDRNPMTVQIKQIAQHLECSERQAQRIRQSIYAARGKPSTADDRQAEILASVETIIGDGDPTKFSIMTMARQIGCTDWRVSLARKAIIEQRATVQDFRTVADREKTGKPKRERLFWTIGDKLFCLYREPQEVG